MNVLVIAPHPDDEAIGCGGAVCLHTERGDSVSAVFLTSGELGLKQLPGAAARKIREGEARKAARTLRLERTFFLRGPDWGVADAVDDLASALKEILNDVSPDLLYLPHPADAHPDHQAALPLLRRALRSCRKKRPRLRGYEVWSPLAAYDHVEDISRVINRKLRALRAHASQLVEFDYVGAVTGLNRYRGVTAANVKFAEVFLDL